MSDMQDVAEGVAFAGLGCLAIIGLALACIAVVLIGLTIPALIIWGVWSWVGVPLFGAPAITFWQSFGLAMLLSLFGGGIKVTVK